MEDFKATFVEQLKFLSTKLACITALMGLLGLVSHLGDACGWEIAFAIAFFSGVIGSTICLVYEHDEGIR